MGKKRLKPYAPEVLEMLLWNFVFERVPEPSDEALAKAKELARTLMAKKPRWLEAVFVKYEAKHPAGDEMSMMMRELTPFLLAYARKTFPELTSAPLPTYR